MVRDAAMQDMEIDTCVGTPQMDRTSDVMTVQLLSPCQLALESLRIVEVPDRVRGQPRTMIAAGAYSSSHYLGVSEGESSGIHK